MPSATKMTFSAPGQGLRSASQITALCLLNTATLTPSLMQNKEQSPQHLKYRSIMQVYITFSLHADQLNPI